ncbi:MAG TPA: nuclear transport factor 2 family protein, partial [Acidobacteriota bacterium]|nr:nuclear transport factor 2 family protein [Acidobacteriota bacterium]
GRERIRESIKRRYPGKKSTDYFTVHQLIQPVIHVSIDGQTAKMRTRLFQLAGASGGSGLWLAGIYECVTGLEDGVWKFKMMSLDYTWTADYKSGWARVSEKEKGIVATPFPKIADLPFHYDNPVTGRRRTNAK